eukprot:14150206-Alexandrium_andersonii.AAC.1
MPLGTPGIPGSFLVLGASHDDAAAGCSWRKRAHRSSWASYSLATKSRSSRASRDRRSTSSGSILG